MIPRDDCPEWNDEVRNDFKLLREAGQDHPDMKKIEALLGIGGQEADEGAPPAAEGE